MVLVRWSDTVNWLTDFVFLEGQGRNLISGVSFIYMMGFTCHCTDLIDEMCSSCCCFMIFIEWERFLVGYTGAPDCPAQHITLSSNHLYKGMSRWIGNGKWNKNSCRWCCNILTITQSVSASRVSTRNLFEWTLASGGNFIRKNLRSDSNIQVATYLFVSAHSRVLSFIHITQSVA